MTLQDVQTELAERRLAEYIKQAWPILEPVTPLIWGWHLDCICEHLEAVTLGQLRFLIINIGPRHMKSLSVAVMWPTWEWGPKDKSHLRYLFSSHSSERSVEDSVKRRTIIESDWYQARWGNRVTLTSDNNRRSEFSNSHMGLMATTSTGANAAGKGGQRVIVDDPIDPKKSYSEAHRKEANRHFDQVLYPRLNDKRSDAMVLIMQRTHQNDPAGHVQTTKKELGWTVLELPTEAPKKTIIVFPISKREIVREEGDLLWPEKETREVVEQTKVMLGSYGYAGQYQQSPSPLEGGFVKRAWWQRYALKPASPYHQLIISSDLAFKKTDDSSRVANHVWASIGGRRYLLARDTRRMGFTESIKSILALHNTYHDSVAHPVTAVLIEDKANGPAVIEQLQNLLPNVVAVEPRGSKFARAMSVSPQIEAGSVWGPNEPWFDEVIDAWAQIPNGDNWDDVDAASQALDYLTRYEISTDAPMMVVGTSAAANLDFGTAQLGRAASLDW